MSSVLSTLGAFAPVVFVIVLGVLSVRSGLVKPDAALSCSTVSVTFCLPALLFDATATTSPHQLADWPLLGAVAVGLLVVYALQLAVGLRVFGAGLGDSTILALVAANPDIAAIGIPLLIATQGKSAVPTVVVANLFAAMIVLPLTLALVATSRRQANDGHGALQAMAGATSHALMSPLVWAPVAGLVWAWKGLPLPRPMHASLSLIGDAFSGLSLFGLGIAIGSKRFIVTRLVMSASAMKLVVQPAVMAAAVWGLAVDARIGRDLVVLGSLPAGSVAAMIAVRFDLAEQDASSAILLGLCLSLLTSTLLTALL